MNWFEKACRELKPDDVLTMLNCDKIKGRFSPCPICGEVYEPYNKRHGKQIKRGPVRTYFSKTVGYYLFYCNACKASGSMFNLAALKLFNVSYATMKASGETHLLRPWFESNFSLCTNTTMAKRRSRPLPPIREYPPADEVKAFYNSTKKITTHPKVCEYLQGRGIDPRKCIPFARIADREFDIESLTKKAKTDSNGETVAKPWFFKNYLWQYPLVFPLFNYKGDFKSVIARNCWKQSRNLKTIFPSGYSCSELFNMSLDVRSWIVEKDFIDEIWITEGEIDYLHLASEGLNVIGIGSGRLSHLQLLQWTPMQKVYIATDNDEAGERYAKKIPNLVQPAKSYRVNFGKLGVR